MNNRLSPRYHITENETNYESKIYLYQWRNGKKNNKYIVYMSNDWICRGNMDLILERKRKTCQEDWKGTQRWDGCLTYN